MTEGSHDRGDSEGVGQLVDGSKPGPDISDVAGSREAEDVVQELPCWFDSSLGDGEAKKIDIIGAKLKLLGVERTTALGSLLQELADPEEVLLDGVVMNNGIINTGLLVLKSFHNLSLPLCVAIASTHQSLWACFVPVSAVRCDKGREVSVTRVERNTVVAIPTVQDTLDLVRRDRGDNGEGRFSVMSLSRSVFVEVGVVHNTARGAVMFGRDNHSTAPGDWSVYWNFLQDSESHVSVQPGLDSFSPVKRDLTGRMNSYWCSLLINKYS